MIIASKTSKTENHQRGRSQDLVDDLVYWTLQFTMVSIVPHFVAFYHPINLLERASCCFYDIKFCENEIWSDIRNIMDVVRINFFDAPQITSLQTCCSNSKIFRTSSDNGWFIFSSLREYNPTLFSNKAISSSSRSFLPAWWSDTFSLVSSSSLASWSRRLSWFETIWSR